MGLLVKKVVDLSYHLTHIYSNCTLVCPIHIIFPLYIRIELLFFQEYASFGPNLAFLSSLNLNHLLQHDLTWTIKPIFINYQSLIAYLYFFGFIVSLDPPSRYHFLKLRAIINLGLSNNYCTIFTTPLALRPSFI